MGCPHWVRSYLVLLLPALLTATAARAAVTVTSELEDIAYRASSAASQGLLTSLVGTMSTRDTSSRGVIYVFKLPTSDTGQTTVAAADFRFTVASFVAKPSYGLDLYALPVRTSPLTLDTDYYFGPLETVPPPTGATLRIVDNLVLPEVVPTPREVSVPFAAGSSFVDFLNAQYGPGGSGAGKYLFLRLGPDIFTTSATEDAGWNVNMAESSTGKPTLTLTFVPEPTFALPAALLLLATLRRRRKSA
jgi:hypothetical protein